MDLQLCTLIGCFILGLLLGLVISVYMLCTGRWGYPLAYSDDYSLSDLDFGEKS